MCVRTEEGEARVWVWEILRTNGHVVDETGNGSRMRVNTHDAEGRKIDSDADGRKIDSRLSVRRRCDICML